MNNSSDWVNALINSTGPLFAPAIKETVRYLEASNKKPPTTMEGWLDALIDSTGYMAPYIKRDVGVVRDIINKDYNDIAYITGKSSAEAAEAFAFLGISKAISSAISKGAEVNIVGTKHNKFMPTQEVVNPKKVEEYANRLRAGEKIPSVKVIEVPGKGKYIINGHHRYVASLQTGIPVEIKIVQNQGPIGMPDWSGVQWKEYISEEQFWGD